MNWVKHPVSLTGRLIELDPLESSHFDELIQLSKVPEIWKHYAVDGGDTRKLTTSLEAALSAREQGTQYPFVIKLINDRKIIGSTRFLDIQQEHRKLEIGWTWLHPNYWGSKINMECKLMLLTFCFEILNAKRVQLKTDENNVRSRKAIEKIGGQFEGIMRNDMIRDNGTIRNSAYYSILDYEWESTKEILLKYS